MRFFLRRLGPGAARGRSTRIRNTGRLMFERLDARQLLAADAAEPIDDAVAYVAPSGVDETSPDAGNAVTSVSADSPLWGDTAAGGIGGGAMMSSESGYGGYGGYGFIPPEILDFLATETTPGMWTFTGRVIDDESVYGLLIDFGGILAGQSTMVRPDGTFELTILLDPNATGIATATVTDWDGITSHQVEYAVG